MCCTDVRLQINILLFPQVWIGLNDRSSEGTFRWSTGGYMSYSNWGSGQPDNDGSWFDDENCVELNTSGRWNDLECSESHYFVCKRGV